MGRDPPFAGLGRAGLLARAIAPDRGLFRPRSAPSSHDTLKQRGVVDEAQITGEKPMESFGAISMIEKTRKIASQALSPIEWHLKSRCNSSVWCLIGANSFILMSRKQLPIHLIAPF